MPDQWINYWYLNKDGKLIKTERLPKKSNVFVYETAERPSPQISRHTFFCPASGETRMMDAMSDEERMFRRQKIVREMLTKRE